MKAKKTKKLEPEQQLKKLGARIKQLRLERESPNRDKFAYQNDLDRVQLGRYENGKSDLQFSSLLKVANAFGMSLKDFFSEGFE